MNYTQPFLRADPTEMDFRASAITPYQIAGTQRVESAKRRIIVFGINVSFFAGVIFVAGFFVSFLLLDIWSALFFVPAFIGAYGLFWSTGKQLAVMDGEFPKASPVPEAPFPSAYFEAPKPTEGSNYKDGISSIATPPLG